MAEGGDRLKPHLRSKPSLKELSNELETIVNWQLLLLDLGIKKHKIDIIELNSPGNISKQKLNALELWLKETPDASSSWMVVIDALYEMDENVLATDLKRKYAFEDPRPHLKDRFVSTPGKNEPIRIVPVGDVPCKMFLPRNLSSDRDYYTLDLTRRIPHHYVVNHDFFAGFMKHKLTNFLRCVEKSESKEDFKVGIEARFGKVYWKLPHGAESRPPTCFKELKSTLLPRAFNPEVESNDVDHLLQVLRGRECGEITMPRVGIIVEGIDAGNYVAVVDEDKGFTLDAVYREQALENKARFDFAIPGRKYDFRIADCSAPLLSENEHSLPCQIARTVTRSMHRLPDRKLSMILRGETPKGESTWKVKFLRQRVQRQYFWKQDKKWILVQYDVDVFDATTNTTVDVNTSPVNEEVNIPEFDYSRKEIELWGMKVFPRDVNKTRPSREKCYYMESVTGVKFSGEAPQEPLNWKAEDLMKDFNEFVGDAFKIATILDGGHP